ncbi:TolC family protein [Algoriphagus terrigena]|uniref:TolC family protein n=1 Tax=Algoriphagus terrigena TaxID=344884 RepID=UPI00041532BB|nr:efflux transporter outer membrane subunit [Algoriphagus terrigena]
MKPYFNLISALLILAVAVSCQVSKDISVPEDAIPEQFRGPSSTDTASLGTLSWEEFFQDPNLKTLIDSAIQKNNDLAVAHSNIEIAQWQLKQAKWGNVPEVDLQIGAVSSRFSDNSLNGLSTSTFLERNHLEDFLLQGAVSWEADIWGKIRSQKKQALAEYLQTVEAQKALQTGIIALVARSYYNLLMLDSQLEVATSNFKLSENTKFIVDLQFESGLVTSLAQQQAAAQLMQAEQLIPLIESQITVEENTLSILTGAFPKAIQRSRLPDTVPVPDLLATGVPVDLVQARPDVKAAELGLQSANAAVGVAQANMYPSFRITAAAGLNAFEATNWFNVPASVFGIVGASVAQPILNRKRLKTAFETAKLEREQTVFQFRQSVLTAVKEVSDALVQTEKLKARQSIIDRRTETLQSAVSDADMLFENGVANYLEVITAQGNLLQSQLDQAAVKRSQLDASIELYRALGGGWK